MIPVKEFNSATEVFRHVKALKRKMAYSEAAAGLAISKAKAAEIKRMADAEAERERRRLEEHQRLKRLEEEAWKRAVERAAKEMEARAQKMLDNVIAAGGEASLDDIKEKLKPRLTPIKYLEHLCHEARVPLAAILGQSRQAEIAYKRHQMIVAVREKFPGMSLVSIGRLFGGRDHSTIIHALRKMEAEKNGLEWDHKRARPSISLVSLNRLREISASMEAADAGRGGGCDEPSH